MDGTYAILRASYLMPGSKRVWDYQAKIRHCDLLHCLMFHDKKSFRKMTFLSFIVLSRNSSPLSRKTSETLVTHLVLDEVNLNPSLPSLRQPHSGAVTPSLPTSPPPLPKQGTNFLCRPRGIPRRGSSRSCPANPLRLASSKAIT